MAMLDAPQPTLEPKEPPPGPQIRASSYPLPAGTIDGPAAGTTVPRTVVRIDGWAMTAVGACSRVELTVDGQPVGRARLGDVRRDVEAAIDLPAARLSGFHHWIDLSEMPWLGDQAEFGGVAIGLDGIELALAPVVVAVAAPQPAIGHPAPHAHSPDGAAGARFASSYVERAAMEGSRLIAPSDLEVYFDQNLEGPGIWKWRHYFPIYERHLARFRGREVRIVEVGIYSGGSLGMWRTYFGPQAHIVGVDIEPACAVYETPETQIFIGDQADRAFWARFLQDVPTFDILIDDGGHEKHQQIATLESLLPNMAPGGVYLCEDIHGLSHGFHDYIDRLSRQLHITGEDYHFAPNALQRSIESIHIYPFVTVIEKRRSPLVVLEAAKHGTQWQPFYDES